MIVSAPSSKVSVCEPGVGEGESVGDALAVGAGVAVADGTGLAVVTGLPVGEAMGLALGDEAGAPEHPTVTASVSAPNARDLVIKTP